MSEIRKKQRRIKLLRIEQLKREQALINTMTDQQITDEIEALESQIEAQIDAVLGNELFKTNTKFKTKLNQKIIEEQLLQRFESQKINLVDPQVTVDSIDQKWTITSGLDTYILNIENSKIIVYAAEGAEIKTAKKNNIKRISKEWAEESFELHM